jgi:transcriptional regulator with PAS, ATPase and Fis domain
LIEFANLLHNNNFVKTLVDSLPCGFVVVDKDGRVQLVNNILERVLKVSKKAVIGKGTGNALGCLHVTDHPRGCGFGECCEDCEVQKLTFDSLSTNQSQRTRAQLKIIIDGQVRDLTLLISASPFTLDDERFCKESPRARNHFVPVNCAALPEGLLETELFGHVKGAFTGAHRDRKGRFEIADGGTIFLDEVAELKPDIQVKLLRVLEDGSFEPVGSEKNIRVNVRVISATNKKLEEEISTGRFRQDLFYRLCVMPIVILPLRDRSEDLPLLVEHFITQFSEETQDEKIALCDTALDILKSHPWPGNVRELINTIKFALVKCKGSRIKPEHLPPTLQLNISKLYPLQARESKLHTTDVVNALKKAKGNKCRAAEILGVSRSTLYRFFAKQPSA